MKWIRAVCRPISSRLASDRPEIGSRTRWGAHGAEGDRYRVHYQCQQGDAQRLEAQPDQNRRGDCGWVPEPLAPSIIGECPADHQPSHGIGADDFQPGRTDVFPRRLPASVC